MNIYGLRALSALNTFTGIVSILVTFVIVVLLFARHEGDFNSGEEGFPAGGVAWETAADPGFDAQRALYSRSSSTRPAIPRKASSSSSGEAFQIVFRAGFSAYTVLFPASPSMVSGAYSIMGYDSIAHLCEELPNPALNAPRAMLGSILLSVPAGLLFILAFLFTVKDIDAVATLCPSGYGRTTRHLLTDRYLLSPPQFPDLVRARAGDGQHGRRDRPDRRLVELDGWRSVSCDTSHCGARHLVVRP